MKRTLLVALVFAFATAFAAEVTVTTNATWVAAPPGGPYWIASVVNLSGEKLYFRKNIPPTALVASNACPISAGYGLTTATPGSGKIQSSQCTGISIKTETGTATADVSFLK